MREKLHIRDSAKHLSALASPNLYRWEIDRSLVAEGLIFTIHIPLETATAIPSQGKNDGWDDESDR